ISWATPSSTRQPPFWPLTGKQQRGAAMPGLGRRFQPGQSGNKAGRPRQDKTITELARQYAPAAIKTLVEVMKSQKSTMTARAIAADRLLDRAFGKAPQAVGVVVGAAPRPASDYSDDELAAIIARATEQSDGRDTTLIEGAAVEEELAADEATANLGD